MKLTRKPKQKPTRDLLVGTWWSANEYLSEVEFTFSRSGDAYAVQIRDGYDGERADIFETNWDVAIFCHLVQPTGIPPVGLRAIESFYCPQIALM